MMRYWKRDGLLIFLLTAVLIFPLFRLKYMDNWGSIESIFIADARMLKDRGFQPQWQPLWYCGTRWDYVYPPALRYSTAFLAEGLKCTTAKAYHIYCGLMYCLGIAGVYWFTRVGSRRRGPAWLVAAASALLAPCLLFIERIRLDSQPAFYPPQRLNVLIRYGEGPHMSSFALIPIALACLWRGLQPGQNRWLAAGALITAGVVSNNFYGATALAMLAPLVVWALWLTCGDHRIALRAAAAGVLAFGLCAWWLTPSFLKLTLYNMRFVSGEGNSWSLWVALATLVLFCAGSAMWAKGRARLAWPVFVTGAVLLFTVNVLGHEYFGFRVIGEPGRLVPEFDLTVFLALALLATWLWDHFRILRVPVALAVAAVFGIGSYPYLRHAWEQFPRSKVAAEDRIEYRTAKWLHENMPAARVLLSGSNRFWANTWFDIAQVGGGSDQGVLNPVLMDGQFAMMNAEPKVAAHWLIATGADAVVTTDATSEEIFHDWKDPRLFEGVLPLEYNDGKGTRIFRVPRRFASQVRVVDRAELAKVQPLQGHGDPENLGAYLRAVEEGPELEARIQRISAEEIRVEAGLQTGQAILIQESYDPSWTSREATIEKDPMGFLLVSGSGTLRFETPLENRAGRWAGGFSLLVLLWLARARSGRSHG